MYADVFWDLKIYVFEVLARAYKLQFFLSVHLGGFPPPPPPIPKSWLCYCPSLYTEVITFFFSFFFFFFFFACLSACSPGKWGPCFWRGGGGGGGLSAQNFSALRKPKAPPPPPSAPPSEKILATPLMPLQRTECYATSLFIWDEGMRVYIIGILKGKDLKTVYVHKSLHSSNSMLLYDRLVWLLYTPFHKGLRLIVRLISIVAQWQIVY